MPYCWDKLAVLLLFFWASFTDFNPKPICEYNNWRIFSFDFWWWFLYVFVHYVSSSFKYTFCLLFAIFVFTLFLFCSRLILAIFFCAHSTAFFPLPVAFNPMFTHSIIFIFINFFTIFHIMLLNYIRCIGSFFYFCLNIILKFFAFALFT